MHLKWKQEKGCTRKGQSHTHCLKSNPCNRFKKWENQSKVHMVMKMVAVTNGRRPSGQIVLLDSSSITIHNSSYPLCLDV